MRCQLSASPAWPALATVLVGGLCSGRRNGMDRSEQVGYADDCLAGNAPPGQFVTGQLLRMDLHTGPPDEPV
jgi:hypothetical protein